MKTIIAGSRNIKDYAELEKAISFSGMKITSVISGTADGVDKMGERYAKENKIPVEQFPADWKKFGKSAGVKRNEVMSKNADQVIAVWDGKSNGTRHMIEIAEKKGMRVFVHQPGTIIEMKEPVVDSYQLSEGKWISSKNEVAPGILANDLYKKMSENMGKKTFLKDNKVDIANIHRIINLNRVQGNGDDKKTYLDVPYKEKDFAKELGARWDKKEELWFIKGDVNKVQEREVMFSEDKRKSKIIELNDKFKESRLYLDIPYEQRAMAGKHGATFDKGEKLWYVSLANENGIKGLEEFKVKADKVKIIETKLEDFSKWFRNSSDLEKIYFRVPYKDIEEARSWGARGIRDDVIHFKGSNVNELSKTKGHVNLFIYKIENEKFKKFSQKWEVVKEDLQKNRINLKEWGDVVESAYAARIKRENDPMYPGEVKISELEKTELEESGRLEKRKSGKYALDGFSGKLEKLEGDFKFNPENYEHKVYQNEMALNGILQNIGESLVENGQAEISGLNQKQLDRIAFALNDAKIDVQIEAVNIHKTKVMSM